MLVNFIVVLLIAIGGALGGFFYGITSSGGVVWPKSVRARYDLNDDESFYLKLTILGLVGNVLIGIVSALAIFALTGNASEVMLVGSEGALTLQLSVYQFGVAIIVGASGDKAINDAIENRQWEKIRVVMNALNPEVRTAQTPIEAAIAMAQSSGKVSFMKGAVTDLSDVEIAGTPLRRQQEGEKVEATDEEA